jgi:hypothetical protein
MVPAGADEAGMGWSCISKSGFWSSFSNPSLLTLRKDPAAGAAYLNRFNISELGTSSAGIILPSGKTVLSAYYSHFGYHNFSRHTAAVSCGMDLSEKLSGGVRIDYFHERTPGEYTERRSVAFGAGITIKFSESTRFGLFIFNPVLGSIRKSFMPSSVQVGTHILLSQSLSATGEAEIRTGGKLRVSAGFEYAVSGRFQVRTGFSSGNAPFSFGVGYVVRGIRIDLGFMVHDRLGISSVASVVYEIGQNSLLPQGMQ